MTYDTSIIVLAVLVGALVLLTMAVLISVAIRLPV